MSGLTSALALVAGNVEILILNVSIIIPHLVKETPAKVVGEMQTSSLIGTTDISSSVDLEPEGIHA